MSTLAALTEAEVIALFADPGGPAFPEVVVGNGDDAAAWLARPGLAQVATTDSLVEGVHFLRDPAWAEALGRKLLAVNLSDLAAMGAEPRYALISVCLPRALEVEFARAVGAGVRDMAREYGVHVIGGNVTRSPGPVVLSATLVGEAEPARLVRRRGARVGDRLWVSGELGGARVALEAVRRGVPLEAARMARLHAPVPRVALGRALAAAGCARAMCDLSDGLLRDAGRVLAPLGARLDVDRLPLCAAAAQVGLDAVEAALAGGEEYELLVVADPAEAVRLTALGLVEIGEVRAEPGLVRSDGGPLPAGFEHFAA